ncbi:MAG: hypothetical protein IT445_21130 [Phycisphaeraceae bacterium]|nr:hypothetical protein [Phycisphaeraceae bacterium]
MDASQAITALQLTGERLQARQPGCPRIVIFVVGGVAGMLTHELPADRTTGDCDVMTVEPESNWQAIASVAQAVGEELGLGNNWLSRECNVFGWQMPLGWQRRCRPLIDFGPLRVMVLDRVDLIASKVMGAPKRPQDRSDLQAMRPTAEELDMVEQHLKRVESESEPGTCDGQHRIVSWLRSLMP